MTNEFVCRTQKGNGDTCVYREIFAKQNQSEKAHSFLLSAFQALLKNTEDMIFVKTVDGIYAAVSQPFVRMVGKQDAAEIIGHTDFEIFESAELAKRYTDDDRRLFETDTDLVDYIEPLNDDKGHPRYSRTSKYILHDSTGEQLGIMGISRDVTSEYLSWQRYQQELRYLFELPEDTYAALFMDITEWRVIRHQSHDVGGHVITLHGTIDEFLENARSCIADPNDTRAKQFFRSVTRETMLELCGDGARDLTLEYQRRMPSGAVMWTQAHISFVVDPETGHSCAVWSLRDIHARKQEAEELQRAAELDEMTGLFNRATTIRKIRREIVERSDAQHALFMIDVDNFKTLNDTRGHQTGDEFLVTMAQGLKKCFREGDVVGRIGGDEFFILMKNIPHPVAVLEKAETLLNVCRMICEHYESADLSVSFGISLFPANGSTFEALYESADNALYRAKALGKNRFSLAEE